MFPCNSSVSSVDFSDYLLPDGPEISVVYFVLVSVFGGKKQPLKFLVPYLRERFQERQKSDERPVRARFYLVYTCSQHHTIR